MYFYWQYPAYNGAQYPPMGYPMMMPPMVPYPYGYNYEQNCSVQQPPQIETPITSQSNVAVEAPQVQNKPEQP